MPTVRDFAAWCATMPLALLLGWGLAAPAARAQGAAAPVSEQQLKAAFVFNFAVFAEWPAEALPAASPLVLCAYHGNALMAALQELRDKSVNGHRLEVRALAAGAAPRACHLLVLDRQDRDAWPQLHHDLAAGGASVLTVANDRQIARAGAMLALSMEDQRVVFEADLGALRAARMVLSSKLLRLARSVQ